jgi:hypothetical protein
VIASVEQVGKIAGRVEDPRQDIDCGGSVIQLPTAVVRDNQSVDADPRCGRSVVVIEDALDHKWPVPDLMQPLDV